jgi:outer membrane protein OmpA-like peptidoglycan-associated protein
VATVSGKLLDKNNNPVAAEIRWEDLQTGKNVGQSKSDPADGSFFIVLPLGKIYGYYIDKNEYFPISNNIDLRTNNKPIQLESDINIVTFKQMIEEGTSVPINNLFFDFAKYDLLPYSIPELQRIATIIKTNNLKVEIDGHTDNIGDEKTNQILSEKRANSVKEFLVNEGCDVSLLTIVGFGETKPVATNENEAGRAKNRRVEFKFIK